ncbi:MAG: hypothetical protein HUU37_10160, partial [Bdellovibrionales bacterium]|nr:hypothetical protein [Bdellovibrionales bacterium]
SFIRGYVDGRNYFSWLKRNTRGVDRGNDYPAATAYNRGGYFTMQDGWAKLSTLGRVGTIIHEARHTEGYYHIACTHGPYGGSSMSGCDRDFAQGGSHGVEMEYYARVVLESRNLHPVYQSMARLMAMGRTNFVFNTKAMQQREAVLISDGRVAKLFDGDNQKDIALLGTVAGSLKRTSFGASFFQGLESTALDIYGLLQGGESRKDDYSYYKLLRQEGIGRPSSAVDFEERDLSDRRYFVALTREGKMASYVFPQGKWGNLSSRAVSQADRIVTISPSGQDGIFVVAKDGAVTPFDPRGGQYGTALPEKWAADVVALARGANNAVYELKANGELRVRSGSGSLPVFKDEHAWNQMVSVPLYDAFQVQL